MAPVRLRSVGRVSDDGLERFLATFWRFIASDDPDMIMMRFCRARKYDSAAGVSMLASCIKWRMVRYCRHGPG